MPQDLILKLREKLSNGDASVIIGSGLSVYTSDNNPVASWKGLLETGINFCKNLETNIEDEWINERYADIKSGKTDRMIVCANEILKLMGGNEAAEFADWIRNTVGSLKLKRKDLIEALYDLDALLITTNYDGLISEATGLEPVTWVDSYRMDKVIRRETEGIIHLHGFWKIPKSIVFDISKYDEIVKNEHAQAAIRALYGTETFLLIGFGGGLEDPNFGNLFKWIKRVYANTEFQIIRLVCEKDIVALESNDHIKNLLYGKEYNELSQFLWELAPKRIYQPAANQLRTTIRSLAQETVNEIQKYKIEWIIAAALDNGCFKPPKKQDYLDPKRRADEYVQQALDDLINEKIFHKPQPIDTMSLVEEVFLADIDDYVLPQIPRSFDLKQITTGELDTIRSCIKELAQKKAAKKMWTVLPDGLIFPKQVERSPNMLEEQTLNLIERADFLRVVSEYGTWMRNDPFREYILRFLKKRGEIQAILSEPPPYESEGYNEWCDSVNILLDWGVRIWLCDRDKHKLHMNIGTGEAISLVREATEINLEKGYTDNEVNVAFLEKEFAKYMGSDYVTSVEDWISDNPIMVKGDDFEIMALGEWDETSVEARWSDHRIIRTNKEIDRFIQRTWENTKITAASRGQVIFSGKLTRLDGLTQRTNKFKLSLSPTTYKEYVGTNRCLQFIKDKVSHFSYRDFLSNPLTVSISLKTKDDKILIGHRSQSTFEHPEYLHVPGGHVHSDKHVSSDRVQVFGAIFDEIEEEIGLKKSDIKKIKCLGLCRARETLKPELVFHAKINLTLEEVQRHPHNQEHIKFEGINDTEFGFLDFLVRYRKKIVPVGKGCLAIYGKYRFGSEWFASLIDKLRAPGA